MARIGLVLGAGGATGHAFHIGALAALEAATGWDPRTADVIVGTSAGAIVAALLRGGMSPRDLAARALGGAMSAEGERLAAVLGPPEPAPAAERRGWSALWSAEPGLAFRSLRRPWDAHLGAVVAALLPAGRIPTDHIVGGIGRLFAAAWPAQPLWINAVRLEDGARVTFGGDGAPVASVAAAVAASCAIPGYYQPVAIAGARYVDGGAHSPTNADVLLDAGLDLVIVSSPMSGDFEILRPAADWPIRRLCRAWLRGEIGRLRARGSAVLALEPRAEDRALMATILPDGARRRAIIRQAHASTRARLAEPAVADRRRILSPPTVAVGREAHPASRTVDLGVPLHYVDYGGDGPPMVMVHGLGGAHVNWMAVAEPLARHARVLVLDLPGFGRTPAAGASTTVQANRALVTRFIEQVAGAPAILVGNSMGGLISLLAAAEAPASVAGMVLVNPALPSARGAFFDLGVAAIFAAYCLPGVGELFMYGRRAFLGSEGSVRQMLDFCCVDAARVPEHVVEATIALSNERAETGGDQAAFLGAARSIVGCVMRRAAFEDMVRRIAAPTLIVHGTHDRLVPLAAAKALGALRPDWSLRIFEDIGHTPQLEDPIRFVEVVTEWLPRTGVAARTRSAG